MRLVDLTADDSVQVDYQIEKIDADNFNLLIHFNLFGSTWIVSPLELDYPYGVMVFEIPKNKHFSLVDSMIENPISVIKNDTNWNKPYKVISEKATLTQKLKLTSKENFEISGSLFFMLEPICSAITLNFTIINDDGTLKVKKSDRNYSFAKN